MASVGGKVGSKSVPTPELAEEQFVNAKISIWWDFESCPLYHHNAQSISKDIVSSLARVNYRGPFSIFAYGDTNRLSSFEQQSLTSIGVSLNHVPKASITRFTDATDKNKKILVDMLLWAVDNPAPANFLLISGDPNFSYALNRLRMRGYNILLAQPELMKPSAQLFSAAKHVWLWNTLTAGNWLPITSEETSQLLLQASYIADSVVDHSPSDRKKVEDQSILGRKPNTDSQTPLSGLAPKPPKRTLDSHSKSQVDVILQTLNMLKAEEMMPTEANIANWIRYGNPKHKNLDVKEVLEIAMENQLIVKQTASNHEVYLGNKEKAWTWVNPKQPMRYYPIQVMHDIENFLSSSVEGRSAILSSESRFEAALIMKRMCLKSFSLGDVILIFEMMLQTKKWLKYNNPSGWQPVSITLVPKTITNVGKETSGDNLLDGYEVL